MRFLAPPSIFAHMTALAQAHQALNLAQGLMWLEPDPLLLQLAATQLRQPGDHHQYSFPAGYLPLRSQVAALSERFFGVPYDPHTEITIVVGATEGLFAAILALTTPGGEALFVEPAYDSYLPAFRLAGLQARSVSIPLQLPWSFPWDRLEEALSPATQLLLLNFPHNPTGLCLRRTDLPRLEAIVERFPQLHLVVDEAYELMTWHPDWSREEEGTPVSVRQSPLLRQRAVIVGSLGKMVGTTGWRLGYVAAPAALTEAIRAVHQFIPFCAATPLQAVVAAYLAEDLDRARYFHRSLLQRRRFFLERLVESTSLEVLPPEGGYFVLVRPLGVTCGEVELAEALTHQAKVATIPLGPFYQSGKGGGWLRLCFARPVELLEEACERLSQVFPQAGASNDRPPG